MFDDLLLNNTTRSQLESLVKVPPHAIGIIGAEGAGKATIATHVVANILDIPIQKVTAHQYIRVIQPEKNSISIESIREIIGFIKLTTTGSRSIRRAIIINDAHTMTIEAQNALLKTLEEPPSDTVVVMTVASIADILPTVASRLHAVHITIPDKATIEQHFESQGYTPKVIQAHYFMSGGLPGIMTALLTSDTEHDMVVAATKAKSIITSDAFERLLTVDDIVKNKQTSEIIRALSQIARSMLYIEAAKPTSNKELLKKWTHILSISESAKKKINQNGQAKLVLTDLFLHI